MGITNTLQCLFLDPFTPMHTHTHTHSHSHSPLTHHILTHVLGVFVVPNKPLGDVDLTRFQVTLEELESWSGTTFHSRLDRSKACMLESHSHTSLTHPMKSVW